jgi:predicted metal-dependent peptidase
VTHSTRASPALARLTEADPALAVLALWCAHRDAAGDTRTAGDTILYGADFAALDTPRQVGVAAHHVLHVALRHAGRMAAMGDRLGPRFDPALYGLAADAIVNETLVLAGHALPRPFICLTELLRRAGLPAQSPRAALSDWDSDRLALALHRDGSAARAARDYATEKGFAPDLEQGVTGADHSTTETEADWRAHLARAMEAGRKAGTGVGTLAALLADLVPPRVPWELRLRGLLARALTETPRDSFRRPAARWVAMEAEARRAGTPAPVFQPGRARDDRRPRLVLCLDTSSSVDDLTLQMFGAEIAAIAARTGAEIHLIGFDDCVHTETRLPTGARDALSTVALRRGGGTAFDPALARAAALGPSAVVVLTDLEAPVGPAPIRAPMIWAVPEGIATVPPYGSVIEIPR